MIEVEVKVLVKCIKDVEKKLQKAGFEIGKTVKESDVYFDNIQNDVKITIRHLGFEAAKIRRQACGVII